MLRLDFNTAQLLDLMLNIDKYDKMNKLSSFKPLLMNNSLKHYATNNKSIYKLEQCFNDVILNNINNVMNKQIIFKSLNGYCVSHQWKNLLIKNDQSKTKYYDFFQLMKQINDYFTNDTHLDAIYVLLIPQIGKLIKTNIQCQGMDFHCRLIITIIIPNYTVLFSIYDCNGSNISIYDLIKNDCEELISNNRYCKDYVWFNCIFTDKTCLNGVGYFLNQWIKYTDHNLYEIESISCCYLFTLWSSVSVVTAIIYNKSYFVKQCNKLKDLKDCQHIKKNLITFIGYDMQRLVISHLIDDAREEMSIQLSTKEISKLQNVTNNKVIKAARTKQTGRRNNGLAPRKQKAIFKARKITLRYQKIEVLYKILKQKSKSWKKKPKQNKNHSTKQSKTSFQL